MKPPDLPQHAVDLQGRTVAFTSGSWTHIETRRPELLDDLQMILTAIRTPDLHEHDLIPGRERFYLRRVTDKLRWLTVVVDFNYEPAIVVTAFIQRKNPARHR